VQRARTSVARLYSIAVAPHSRGRGVSTALLQDATRRMRDAGAAVLRLETRADNIAAQRVFASNGFVARGRKPAYYEDGEDALLYQKSLWDLAPERDAAALRALLRTDARLHLRPVFAADGHGGARPATRMDRTSEIRIWREATTVFMAAGHGGCGPHGLALAAEQRGFRPRVHAPSGKAMFIESVRDLRKKEVIELVEADFRAERCCVDAKDPGVHRRCPRRSWSTTWHRAACPSSSSACGACTARRARIGSS
jgi:hypothetical protein